MLGVNITEEQLVEYFDALLPWTTKKDFSESEWASYLEVAGILQQTDPKTVEAALDKFIAGAANERYAGYESESKAFILLRVVFDLPEVAPVGDRRSFKGWINWPEPDANDQVSLSWPVSWPAGRPMLVAAYEGSLGQPYAASLEYHYLHDHFPYRQLGEPEKEKEKNP